MHDLLKILHAIQQTKSLISVEFHGLICSKISMLVFKLQEQHQNTHLCRQFFNRKIFLKQTVSISRNLQVQYLALVCNNFHSSLRRLSYSLSLE